MNELDAAVALVSLWQEYEQRCYERTAQAGQDKNDKARWMDAKAQLYAVNDMARALVTAASTRAGGTPVYAPGPIDPNAAG